MKAIIDLEKFIKDHVEEIEQSDMLHLLNKISLYLSNLETENTKLKKEIRNQEITIQSKEDVIKMLSNMIRGVIDE